MNEIKVFENQQFGQVRSIVKDGEPWFVAADVCNYFGVTNRNRVMQDIDKDEKGGTQIDTPGGKQTVTIINESGLYSLLFALQPQKARGVSEEYILERQEQLRQFKRWITHEVIPAIRKHGGYLTPEKVEEVLLNPDTIIQLATQLKESHEKVKALEAQRAIDAPKVLFAQCVAASESDILIGQLAKILKQNGVDMGQNRLFEILRRDGYLISQRGGNWNMPTQRSMEQGLMRIKETAVSHSDGHVTVSKTPKITGKGQIYFVQKYCAGI